MQRLVVILDLLSSNSGATLKPISRALGRGAAERHLGMLPGGIRKNETIELCASSSSALRMPSWAMSMKSDRP
jgi:hypothetical protein